MVRPIGYGAVTMLSLALTFGAAEIASTQPVGPSGGPRFRTDGWQSDEYGRAEGYPAAARAKGEQKKFLIGSYSRWDALETTREIAAPPTASPLVRSPAEPAIRLSLGGASLSLDDYLDRYPITGLLIARGDRILVERYQYDRRDGDRFQSMSMAKTIVALLVGIAIRDGHISSINDTAERYIPPLRDSEFGRTSIKALLQMSSGIRFKHHLTEADLATDDTAVLNRLRQASILSAVQQFNERAAPPGRRFNYTSADNFVLGLVLAAATGKSVADYTREKLWVPLGAESKAVWRINDAGEELTACCFGATLRDYARLGLMLAHDGAWRGHQIVPRDWLLAATTVAPLDRHLKRVSIKRNLGYGYQTWLLAEPGRMFVLRGFRGQELFVDPQTKTVMVQTAVWPVGKGDEVMELWRGVLASLR